MSKFRGVWANTAATLYGGMSTPALTIDGKVVSYGKVLEKNEIIKILKEVRS